MTKFARMTEPDADGVQSVIECIDVDPDGRFHPDIAAQFVDVPDDVVAGSILDDGVWSHPSTEPAEPETQYRTSVSPVEFKMLFTVQERVAIRIARAYDGDDAAQKQVAMVIDDWWSILDDPRLDTVRLDRPQTLEGLEFLVASGVLAQDRRDEIARGEPE